MPEMDGLGATAVDARDRAQLVMIAYEVGVATPGSADGA